MAGINYGWAKQMLMKRHKVSATQLDNGVSVPDCVYGLRPKPVTIHKQVFNMPLKIGKATSIANRMRVLNQSGSNLSLEWIIWCNNRPSMDFIEKDCHRYFDHLHLNYPGATEFFEISESQTFVLFNEYIKDLVDRGKHGGVKSIEVFDSNNIQTINMHNYLNQLISEKASFKETFDAFFEYNG